MNNIRFLKVFIFTFISISLLNSCTLFGTPSAGKAKTGFDSSIVGREPYTNAKDTFTVTYSVTGKSIDDGDATKNAITFKDQKKWKQGWYNSLPSIDNISFFYYQVQIELGDVTAIGDDIDMSNPRSFYGIMYNQAGKPITITYYETMDFVNFILNNKLNRDDYTGGKKLAQFIKEREMYGVLYFVGKDKVKYYLKLPSLRVDYLKEI